jgi:hypothetical protein
MRRDVQRMPKSWEKSTRKNTQHAMINQLKKMQRCVYGREREASLKSIEILSRCVT